MSECKGRENTLENHRKQVLITNEDKQYEECPLPKYVPHIVIKNSNFTVKVIFSSQDTDQSIDAIANCSIVGSVQIAKDLGKFNSKQETHHN